MSLNTDQQTILQNARGTTLNRLLLLARRRIMDRIRTLGAEFSLPNIPPAYLTLLPYIDLEGTRPAEIAERAQISKQAVNKAIETLSAFNLINKLKDSTDGRTYIIKFTPTGLDCILSIHKSLQTMEQELQQLIGRSDLERLKANLELIAFEGNRDSLR